MEKNKILWAVLAAVLSIALFCGIHYAESRFSKGRDSVRAGFILDGDESTPYSGNFIRTIDALKLEYGDRLQTVCLYNVAYEDTVSAIKQLADAKCDIIFANSYSYGEIVKEQAPKYPQIQFCEATCDNANTEPFVENYHTFMGEIYQGRYIAGIVAGMKMQEMIDEEIIDPEDAWIGYVGAYPYAEVISGYTAFFLGARSQCPTARMRVRYTNTWTAYMLEKKYAEELINEGCVIISQHSDTIGPAVSCESADVGHPVYHVGYNQDMIDVAPTTSLIGTRIDWTPYMSAAVGAVLMDKRIEDNVVGHVHGNDVGAGFEEGWIQMLELNTVKAPYGCEEMIQSTMADFKHGRCHVFKGDYIGVNPDDPDDIWDLKTEYLENSDASAPSFHYILKDVIILE